jgi:hypothetical protein
MCLSTAIVQSQLGLDISTVPGLPEVSAALASINGIYNLTEVEKQRKRLHLTDHGHSFVTSCITTRRRTTTLTRLAAARVAGAGGV